MKDINFKVVTKDNKELQMVLIKNKNESPIIKYKDNTYNSKNPGEVLDGPMIKNPKPLPKGTYGFIIDEMVIIFHHSITGNNILLANEGYEAHFNNKNYLTLVIKIVIVLIMIGIIAISISSLF